MEDDRDRDRAQRAGDAWRSCGAHDLARRLVIIAREAGADRTLQEAIAEVVIETEEAATDADVVHALRE